MFLSLSLLLLTASALHAAHHPSDVSEYKRQLTYIDDYLYLGSDAFVGVYPISSPNASVSVIALTPFRSNVPLKIRRVFSTAHPKELLVQANVSMYHPMAYLYYLDVTNVTSISVKRAFPVAATSLDNPIFAYTEVESIEYLIAIDNFSALKLLKLGANGVELLDTITGIGAVTFAPYSIAVNGATVVIADLVNGLVVFSVKDDELLWSQTIAAQGSATSVFLSNGTAWLGTENGVWEYERNIEGMFEQVDFIYPMVKTGLYPYYLFGTQSVVGFIQYDTKDNSRLAVYPRLQSKAILEMLTRFDPFLILESTLYLCAKGKLKEIPLNLG